jgi:tetratricopeptide (TPR) repeat protein
MRCGWIAAAVAALLLAAAHSAAAEDWNSQAIALQRQQDWNGLKALAERWTGAAPEDFGGWTELGLAYDMLRRPDLAVPAYEKALALRPDSTAWLQLAEDYHALGQREKLRQLKARLQQANPMAAQMIAMAHPEDLAPAGGKAPLLPRLSEIARFVLRDARHWQGDAVLVGVEAINWSRYPYAVATGHAYDVAFTLVSRGSRHALIAKYSGGYSDLVVPDADRLFADPLPDRFLDLSEALDRARRAGMAEDWDRAILATWHARDHAPVAAWVIAPTTFDPNHPAYLVDAVNGGQLDPVALFDEMPGNDAEIKTAVEMMKRVFAPPAQSPAPQLGGVPANVGCIMCQIHAGQAAQYVINHPGASMGEALAATAP